MRDGGTCIDDPSTGTRLGGRADAEGEVRAPKRSGALPGLAQRPQPKDRANPPGIFAGSGDIRGAAAPAQPR